MAVAVVVNQKRLTEALGEDATPEKINQQLDEIRQLVSSAIGFNEQRGDQIKVSAVDFIDAGKLIDPVPSPTIAEQLIGQTGSIVKALTFLVVSLALIMLGLRPVVRALTREPALNALPVPQSAETENGVTTPALDNQSASDPNMIQDQSNESRDAPQRRLQQLVEIDEDHAVSVMKELSREGVAA